LGVYSDPPPGMQPYHPTLTSKGEPTKDRLGLDLLECDRGTGNIENSHRINRDTSGTRQTGIESSDALSAERRHQHNHRGSEIHRKGLPKVGHYDTWLVDQEQILMEQNHNVILYPTWSNPASDNMDTAERFQTLPLHSDALNNAIHQLRIPLEVRNNFPVDQKFLYRVMGTIAQILPINGREAYTLFEKLMLERLGEPDDELSLEWVNHVDALEIYPTTVFYLQSCYKKWKRNQRAKDCVNDLVADCARLNRLNRSTLQNEGAREGSSLAVEWPDGSAGRPAFPILNESVEAGRVDDSPLIVGTTAVDRKSTLDARHDL
jgi:hypothetical protein